MPAFEILDAIPDGPQGGPTVTLRVGGIAPVAELANALAGAPWQIAKDAGVELAERTRVRLHDDTLQLNEQVTHWRGQWTRRDAQLSDVGRRLEAIAEGLDRYREGGTTRDEAARLLRELAHGLQPHPPQPGLLGLALRAATVGAEVGPASELAGLLRQAAHALDMADLLRAWIDLKLASPHQAGHDGHRDGFCLRCASLYEHALHAINAYDTAGVMP
jgi:hypothetical protein